MKITAHRAPALPVLPPPITIVAVEMSLDEARQLSNDIYSAVVGRGLRPAWFFHRQIEDVIGS